MQIDIHAIGIDLDERARAYIEYRMFSAARQFEINGAEVSVLLEEDIRARARFRCLATVMLPDGRVRVSGAADRLHAAVDRAADRLSQSVERRLAGGPAASGPKDARPRPNASSRVAGKESES